jgi:hypothetical protein
MTTPWEAAIMIGAACMVLGAASVLVLATRAAARTHATHTAAWDAREAYWDTRTALVEQDVARAMDTMRLNFIARHGGYVKRPSGGFFAAMCPKCDTLGCDGTDCARVSQPDETQGTG